MKRSLLLSFAAMVLGLGLSGCAYVEGDEDGECSDGVDNDQDGTLDCGDPGCISAAACAGDDDDTGSDDDDSASDDDDGSPDDDDSAVPGPFSSTAIMHIDIGTELGEVPGEYSNYQLLRTVAHHINLHESCSFSLSSGTHTIVYVHPTLNDHEDYKPPFLSSWVDTGRTGTISILDRDGNPMDVPTRFYEKSVSGTFSWDWLSTEMQDRLSYFVGAFLIPPGVTVSGVYPELYKVIPDISGLYSPTGSDWWWAVTASRRPDTTVAVSSWDAVKTELEAAGPGDVIELASGIYDDQGTIVVNGVSGAEDNPVWLVPPETTLAGETVPSVRLRGTTSIELTNSRGIRIWGFIDDEGSHLSETTRFIVRESSSWVSIENCWFDSSSADNPEDSKEHIRLQGHYNRASSNVDIGKASRGDSIHVASTAGNDTATQFILVQNNYHRDHNVDQSPLITGDHNAFMHMGGSSNQAERMHGIWRKNHTENWFQADSEGEASPVESSGWILSQNVAISNQDNGAMGSYSNRRAAWTLMLGNYHDARNNSANTGGLLFLGVGESLGAEYADTDLIYARHFVRDHSHSSGYLEAGQVSGTVPTRFVANNVLVSELYGYGFSSPLLQFSSALEPNTPAHVWLKSIAVETSSEVIDEDYDSSLIPVTYEGCKLAGGPQEINGGLGVSPTPPGIVVGSPNLEDRGDGVFVSDDPDLEVAVKDCIPVALQGPFIPNLGTTYISF